MQEPKITHLALAAYSTIKFSTPVSDVWK